MRQWISPNALIGSTAPCNRCFQPASTKGRRVFAGDMRMCGVGLKDAKGAGCSPALVKGDLRGKWD
jgi:hypothetical protein